MNTPKRCPLCGGIVTVESDKKVFPTCANQYSDCWYGCFRVQIKCKPCALSMDITYYNGYETEQDAMNDYENITNEVIGLWNRRTGE